MEYAATKASSEPPAVNSSASSTHSAKPNDESTPTKHDTPLPPEAGSDATPNSPVKNDTPSKPSSIKHIHEDPEDDPRAQLIETLRTQLTDVHTQLSQLNSKLVQSYDRVSHLEDSLELANSTLQKTNARVSELEASQAQHEAALESGVLVEREHVAHELSQLMERATKEAAQRGEADAARSRIETELDDLSADLFGRANTMVAEARIARAASERRVEEAENALKGAEVAVKSMQTQMQLMAEARREAEAQLAEMRVRMGKGKWVDRSEAGFEVDGPKRRLYNSHTVYREFMAFVLHLRGLRATGGVMPQMAALASLPFVARLVVEDCDPTLRLDLAPALNWLTRRAVHAAILQGQLEIEPVYGLMESECALCGLSPHGPSTPSGSAATSPTTTTHTLSPKAQGSGAVSMAAWASSTSKYLKGSLGSPTTSPHTTQAQAQAQVHPIPPQIQRQITDPNAPPVYIFRVAGAQNAAGAAPMALCSGGWCLARLRATCELCSFIKRGVVEKVWSEAPLVSAVPPPTSTNQYLQSVVNALGRDKEKDKEPKDKDAADAPPVPPRRRQLSSLGTSIWEKGLGAFGGSRNASRSGTPAPEEAKEPSPMIPHRVPPPLDAKPAAVPPPPPPRSRPVPPVPPLVEPESKADTEEHHEEIHHAMVFDAADAEHGHHAVSPTTDKRHSIPPPLVAPAPNPTESPKLENVPLPPVNEADPTAEKTAAPAPTTDEPPVTSEGTPAAKSEPETQPAAAPETPRRPPPISRPPRRFLPNEDKPPMSPRTVTLPDSRPGTPVPDERPSTPSPHGPARAMSPTPGSSPLKRTGSLRRDAESGRASSPVPGDGGPPKVPKRAPRRAVPVPPGAPSAPTTAPEPEKVEEKEAKAEEDKVEEKPDDDAKSAVPRPPPRRTVPPPPAPPLPVRARAPQPVEGTTAPEELAPNAEAKPVNEPIHVEEVKPTEAIKPVEETKPVDEAKSSESPIEDVTHSVPPVATIVTSTTEDNLANTGPTIDPAPAYEKQDVAEKKPMNGSSSTSNDDPRFVGERSWEERAYKEIIKLREDMFWARIGSAW